ncbi:chemotaxis protein methyltransferase CheR [Sphingomonas sp. PP-CE-3G-477]|uniref:CheR family methyltransferase n=1 Tax=unclassified Sphingomonas TaxID=196159 RepID=UPI000D3AAA2B|nr:MULTISPECIES: protein-glutamate O-methyltransferase CheR [unclassified Sphingomonas]MBE2992810.1 protein-glutamate O-methyltransferase CheR [Sphingomonas sp. CFBP 13603]PTQ63291.1 chemotaxis protein methyltransferase CheR [Sphingomonas sp. PP-CE-3G-477]
MTHRDLPTSSTASQTAISVLTALLEARTGQQIAAYRSWRLDTALKPLLRARKLDTLDQLVTQLLQGSDRQIGDSIVDALVNQETSFFRDALVFEMLAEAVTDVEQDGRRARIWCAGCSTGQEPLSLAMQFAERRETSGASMPEIVATDVSDAAIVRARSGRFSQFEIQRGLPVRRMIRWFDTTGTDWVAKPELLALVTYRRMNLVSDQPPPGQFDIVLCRNVLLYLSTNTKGQVFPKIAAALKPGGMLVMGAGETVIGQTRVFEPSKRFRGFYETPIEARS